MQVHLQYTNTIKIRGNKQRPDQGRYKTMIRQCMEWIREGRKGETRILGEKSVMKRSYSFYQERFCL